MTGFVADFCLTFIFVLLLVYFFGGKNNGNRPSV